MLTSQLSPNANIIAVLRTHQLQKPAATTRAILARIAPDEYFAPLINKYILSTRHHSHQKADPFKWAATPDILYDQLAQEPRARIILEGDYPSIRIYLDLNCTGDMIKEKVNGKLRNAPRPSDTSMVTVSAFGTKFADSLFTQAYLNLLGDLFEIVEGDYGKAEHPAVRHGTAYDQAHQDLFEPAFISWANLFGPRLVARIGIERLLTVPAYQFRELSNGGVLFTISPSPLVQLEPKAQQTIAQIKAHLGTQSPTEKATLDELAEFERNQTIIGQEMRQRIEQSVLQVREQTTLEMQRQAEGCVMGVKKFWGKTLDFSISSLMTVDHLIENGFQPNEPIDTINTGIHAFGAYVGEVVRRNLGGEWQNEVTQGQPVLLQVGSTHKRIEPFDLVARRFQERSTVNGFRLFNWYRSSVS